LIKASMVLRALSSQLSALSFFSLNSHPSTLN
jgi:hypothetical protein